MIKPEHDKVLRALGTTTVRHSGRDLYAHLVGTHDLLKYWGNDEDTCTAGLFHSVYGTNSFKHATCSFNDRARIVALIGADAELMAYLFCALDRPGALFTLRDWQMRRKMLEIETANLIEQNIGTKWLLRIRKCDISDAAKQAVDAQLRKAPP